MPSASEEVGEETMWERERDLLRADGENAAAVAALPGVDEEEDEEGGATATLSLPVE